MKKIFAFAILFAAMAMTACNNTTYTINGTDASFEDGTNAYIQLPSEGGRFEAIDTMAIVNNSFTFTGEVEQTKKAFVTVGDNIHISLFLEPGTINISKANPEDRTFSVTGTPMNDLRNELSQKSMELMNKYINAAAGEAGFGAITLEAIGNITDRYGDVPAVNGEMCFRGDALAIARLNLNLRTADRVYIRLAKFPATTFDDLYDGVYTIDWKGVLSKTARVIVNGKKVETLIAPPFDCDITKYLKKGENTICALVWYWDNETSYSYSSSGQGGFIFEAINEDVTIISDKSWKAKRNRLPTFLQ